MSEFRLRDVFPASPNVRVSDQQLSASTWNNDLCVGRSSCFSNDPARYEEATRVHKVDHFGLFKYENKYVL